jgi:hypothetical protein
LSASVDVREHHRLCLQAQDVPLLRVVLPTRGWLRPRQQIVKLEGDLAEERDVQVSAHKRYLGVKGGLRKRGKGKIEDIANDVEERDVLAVAVPKPVQYRVGVPYELWRYWASPHDWFLKLAVQHEPQTVVVEGKRTCHLAFGLAR